MDLSVYKKHTYRNDIQGIRAIGAILIMTYHIWFNKVSGGIDVFFVVSGYFMTRILVQSYLQNKKIKPFEFWGIIIRRVAPLAYTVIFITFILSYFFMPPNLWQENINETLSSALHIENWRLIRTDKDYLSSGNPPSPLQQFWALSLQIQFYFALPLILYIGFKLSNKINSHKAILYILLLVIAVSLSFSIYYTEANPSAAYFNTGARAWEFFIGVLIFIIAPFIIPPPKTANFLMWTGFLLILLTGILVPRSAAYPGYIALIPVTAAAIIILAGTSNTTGYIYKFLSSKILVYIGGISFPLYLWHWPILIYYQNHSEKTSSEINITEGLIIIALAFIFSIFSKKQIENRFSKIKKTSVIRLFAFKGVEKI